MSRFATHANACADQPPASDPSRAGIPIRRAAGLLRRQRCGPVRAADAPPATRPLSAPAGRTPGLCPGITRGLPLARGSSASIPCCRPRQRHHARGCLAIGEPRLHRRQVGVLPAQLQVSALSVSGLHERANRGSCLSRHSNEPWNSAYSTTASRSRIGSRLSIFQAKAEDLHLLAVMDRALAEASKWDETELDEIIRSEIASSHRRADEGEWASNLMDRQTRQTLRQAPLSGQIPGTPQPPCPMSPPGSHPQWQSPFESARFRDAFGHETPHSSGMATSTELEAIVQGRGKT